MEVICTTCRALLDAGDGIDTRECVLCGATICREEARKAQVRTGDGPWGQAGGVQRVGTMCHTARKESDPLTLKELVESAHMNSVMKGWYDGEDAKRNIPEMLALIHSEVSEALECYRDGHMDASVAAQYNGGDPVGIAKPVGFPSEIADVVIRIGDLCGYLGIDLEKAVTEKMAYNATRTYRHGGKKA